MWTFNIDPVREPRMSRRDKFDPSPAAARYYAYANELHYLAREQEFEIGSQVEIIFLIPMPRSWSKKKQAAMKGKSHEQTPDADNLLKAFCDALAESDCYIWNMKATKFWWDEGKVIVMENKTGSGELSDYLNSQANEAKYQLHRSTIG